ncbi:MAG: DUF5118 domain-containing protein, partial [Pirellulales bacterium]
MLAIVSRLRSAVPLSLCLLAVIAAALVDVSRGDETRDAEKKENPATVAADAGNPAAQLPPSGLSGTSGPRSKHPPYSEFLKDFKTVDGLIKLHRKENQLYAEISPSQLNRDFIVLISISRGIGEWQVGLIAGMTWGFGDDWLWQFRKVDDNIQIVRRNVRFRAAHGSPEEKAVKLAYTDSVLFSLPIVTTGPSGGMVIDIDQVFMSDLPQ